MACTVHSNMADFNLVLFNCYFRPFLHFHYELHNGMYYGDSSQFRYLPEFPNNLLQLLPSFEMNIVNLNMPYILKITILKRI